MRRFARLSKRICLVILSLFALLLALPVSVGAQDAADDRVFVSIRHYGGLDPDGQDELYRLTAEGFLPIIRDSEATSVTTGCMKAKM